MVSENVFDFVARCKQENADLFFKEVHDGPSLSLYPPCRQANSFPRN